VAELRGELRDRHSLGDLHARVAVTLTGKPVLWLTAIGRRSGRPWTVPLLYLRDDDDLIVCNVRPPWERRNPWPLNVRANAEVTIRINGVAEPRRAREARPEEIERLWPRLAALWPPYEGFFARAHVRNLRARGPDLILGLSVHPGSRATTLIAGAQAGDGPPPPFRKRLRLALASQRLSPSNRAARSRRLLGWGALSCRFRPGR
jgi:deazaflavin-dependent oxidoreductase (nitroreductase family)